MTVSFTWPVGNTPHSAALFWGWMTITVAMLDLVILAGFFVFDAVPYIYKRRTKHAVFGFTFAFVGLTSGLSLLSTGIGMIDMTLTPTGPRPIDMLAISGCFTPLVTFGWQRVRNLRGLPDSFWSGPRIAVVLMTAAAFAASFVTRFIDVTRFRGSAFHWHTGSIIDLVLGALYLAMSGLWLRYQWATRMRDPYGWNAIGASLGLVFFQFAFVRLAEALLLAAGVYREDDSTVAYSLLSTSSLLAVAVFLVVAVSLLRRSGRAVARDESGRDDG